MADERLSADGVRESHLKLLPKFNEKDLDGVWSMNEIGLVLIEQLCFSQN